MNKLKGYLEKKDNEIMGIASTDSKDRHGEVIKQEGWDLKQFKKNPVILASHNSFEFPIGKATNIKVSNGKLIFTAVFSEATQMAREAYQLVKEGILNCFSVGFIPKARDEKDESIITNAELLEISLVAIPANSEAVVIAKSLTGNKFAEELIVKWVKDEKILKGLEEKKIAKVELSDGTKFEIKDFDKSLASLVIGNNEPARKEEAPSKEIRLLKMAVANLQTVLCERNKRKEGEKK
jgi:HK97 family phage prohead protease